MTTTKLTVRIHKELLESAKRYASEHETTLTRLIAAYLRQLANQDESAPVAPIVQRLSGSLTPETEAEDYHRYLDRKYGGEA